MISLQNATLPSLVTCALSECSNELAKDNSHRFGVGISHYTNTQGDMVRSYAQVFNTLHSCDRPHALAAIKDRIDNHASIPFGTYDPSVHNPSGEHTDETCKINLEYNTEAMVAKAQLPKSCAICGKDLGAANDVYIPHVDDSTRGTHYQGILQKYIPATIESLTLGACSLQHAQMLAHAILDEIVEPDFHGTLDIQALQNAPMPVPEISEDTVQTPVVKVPGRSGVIPARPKNMSIGG